MTARPPVIGFAMLVIAMLLAACSPTTIVNSLTPRSGFTASKDIAYGPAMRHRLDVYAPRQEGPPRPVVIYFYGGRWQRGSKDQYLFVGEALTSQDFLAVVVDHRLYPRVRFPAFVEDGALAVAWARAHIEQYGGDPDKLFVMGHSSGAHIAAMLNLDERYLAAVGGDGSWLKGMIGIAGPYDFLPLEDADLQDMFGPPLRYPASQPIEFVDGSEPPMLLLHGLKDKTVLVRNTRNLAALVTARGGQVETVFYARLAHLRIVGALAAPLRGWAPVLGDTARFVRETVETL